MGFLKKYKWFIHWSAFGLLVGLFVFFACFFEDRTWIANVLQTIGTFAGIYLTLIIFLHSKEESDKQFREHLEHLQKLNLYQIEALQNSTERQIKTLQELNGNQITALQNSTVQQIKALQKLHAQQIEALQDATEKQINAMQEVTERQIDALYKSTYDEISSFERNMTEVTNKLTDNSILLAEILGRELEKSLELYNGAIQREEAKFNDLSKWKLLRTPYEREQQLNHQWNRIQQIKKGYEYLVEKYKQVKNFLGIGQKKLNE